MKVFRKVYEKLYEYMKAESIPNAVIILGEYQYKSAFVADQEINLLACLTEIMSMSIQIENHMLSEIKICKL